MSRDTLRGLVEIVDEKEIDTVCRILSKFVEEDAATPDEVEALVGHGVGGVCPFAVRDGVSVYLDESLKRFQTVFPACGSSSSAIELSIEELEKYSCSVSWVDVGKGWKE